MVYQEKFVVVVKCNGKILREKDGVITLPFGSDYSLLFKNLDSRKANVNVSIDGSDVLSGSSLIIRPDTSMELEGFLENSVVKNKFRFIQKTQEIQEHRGDKIDDGIIRVEFAFEKQTIRKQIIHEDYYFPPIIKKYHYWYDYPIFRNEFISSSLESKSTDNSQKNLSSNSFDFVSSSGETIQAYNCSSLNVEIPKEDEGITVKGAETKQQFHSACIGELEPSQVIIIKLSGSKQSGEKVEKPVTVTMKLQCPTCAKQNKSNHKYCSNCGTYLA
jgi:hypothetical protein